MSKKNPAPDAATEARGGRSPSYTALNVEQNGHSVYYTTIPIDEVFAYCIVERRHEIPVDGFQRRLSETRAASREPRAASREPTISPST